MSLIVSSIARGVNEQNSIVNNSAIHKAAGSLVTGHSQKTACRNTPQRWFLPAAPIDSQWTLFCSTGIVPVEIMEWLGSVRPVAW